MGEYIDLQKPERRGDAVAIPRKAFSFALTLVALFVGGVGAQFYSLTLDNVRINGRLETLELFGPVTGQRFTHNDGEDLKEADARLFAYIQRVDESVTVHHAAPEHEGADRRLINCERWRYRHDEKHEELNANHIHRNGADD